MLVSIHLQKVFGRFKFINPVDTGRCCVLCWVDSINCRVWWNTNTTGFVVGRPVSLNCVGNKQGSKYSWHPVINMEFLSQRTPRGKTSHGVDHRINCGYLNGSIRGRSHTEQINSLLVTGYCSLLSNVAEG